MPGVHCSHIRVCLRLNHSDGKSKRAAKRAAKKAKQQKVTNSCNVLHPTRVVLGPCCIFLTRTAAERTQQDNVFVCARVLCLCACA